MKSNTAPVPKTPKAPALVHISKNKPLVSTLDLYEGFGYKKHRALKKVIFKHEPEFKERGKLIVANTEATIIQAGMPETAYLLNEKQFTLLCLLVKNTDNSVLMKCAIADEFNRMREALKDPIRPALIQYKRDTSKPLTDMLKAIIEHEGKTPKPYDFSNEHLRCNRALTGEYTKIDESTLSAYDLALLGKIRERDTVLVALRLGKSEHNRLLDEYVKTYRAKNNVLEFSSKALLGGVA